MRQNAEEILSVDLKQLMIKMCLQVPETYSQKELDTIHYYKDTRWLTLNEFKNLLYYALRAQRFYRELHYAEGEISIEHLDRIGGLTNGKNDN